MRPLYLYLVSTGLLLSISPLLFAEDAHFPITLSPMTILETPQTLDEINKSYSSQQHEVYDKADLAIAHERTIDNLLNAEQGISITKPGSQGTGRIYLRGVGGRGLLSLDGIPLPDSVPNAMNLGILIPDGLDEMDVMRGFAPASNTFAALGGAIKLTSRDATDNSANLRVEGGTYGFLKETWHSDFIHQHARLAITVNHSDAFDGAYQAQESNGNSERDPFHHTQVMVKTGVDITPDILWEGSMFYRTSFNNADAGALKNGIIQQVDDRHSYIRDVGWLAQNTLHAKLTDDWITRFQMGYSTNDLLVAQSAISPSIKTNFYSARWENNQRLWHDNADFYHLIWGAEERYETGFAPLAERGPPPKMTGITISQHRQQQAGFFDNRFNYGFFSGDVGVRYESYEHYNGQILLHLGTGWQLTQTLKLTTNAGNGFRIPSYSELLFPMTGDLNLKPERNIGGDLGLEWQALKNLKLTATGFYTRYNNLINLSYNLTPPCGGVCLSNISNTLISGAETGGELVFNAQWRGGFAYTYTQTENLANHQDIPFRPAHVTRIWGEWKSATMPLTLWSEGIFQSQAQQNMANTLPVDEMFFINVHANYQVTPKLDFYIRGENLTNNTTPSMFSHNQTGATIYGGVSLKLW